MQLHHMTALRVMLWQDERWKLESIQMILGQALYGVLVNKTPCLRHTEHAHTNPPKQDKIYLAVENCKHLYRFSPFLGVV